MSSEVDEEAESAAKCLRKLTNKEGEEVNSNWKPAHDNGIVGIIIKVSKSYNYVPYIAIFSTFIVFVKIHISISNVNVSYH